MSESSEGPMFIGLLIMGAMMTVLVVGGMIALYRVSRKQDRLKAARDAANASRQTPRA